MRYYQATLYPAKKGGYTVFFKDFPEALTQGADINEALENAREALALTIEEYIIEGRDMPEPTLPHQMHEWALINNPRGQTMNGVEIYPIPALEIDSHPVRVSISFTKSALGRIDEKAAALGMTRSGYLAAAGLGYNSGPNKNQNESLMEQFDELGRTYGLGRKPTETYVDFASRIFHEMNKACA